MSTSHPAPHRSVARIFAFCSIVVIAVPAVQFWLLFSTSALLCTGGMGLLAVARPMITEVFSTSLPGLVTASFSTGYLLALAGGNLAGRLGWAAVSDRDHAITSINTNHSVR